LHGKSKVFLTKIKAREKENLTESRLESIAQPLPPLHDGGPATKAPKIAPPTAKNLLPHSRVLSLSLSLSLSHGLASAREDGGENGREKENERKMGGDVHERKEERKEEKGRKKEEWEAVGLEDRKSFLQCGCG